MRGSGPASKASLADLFAPDDPAAWADARGPGRHAGRLVLAEPAVRLPAAVWLWPTRRSYTGEPLLEIHTVASPPVLESILDVLFTRGIRPARAGEFTLRNLIEKHYANDQQELQSLLKDMEATGEDVEVVEEAEEEIATQAQIEDAPVVKLINGMLIDAVKRGASDIHIEPFEHEIRVRYRIDGALLEIMWPPLKMKAALTSRVKILSQLNIAERRVPQDGRLKLKLGNRVIDFRVSTLPVLFGEKIVLRILDKGNLTLDLEKFGMEPMGVQKTLRYRPEIFGSPFSDALQQVLRGPSDWSPGERELFAAFTSLLNSCHF